MCWLWFCLVCSLRRSSNCPGHICSTIVFFLPPLSLSLSLLLLLCGLRCQWWWWNQPLRQFEQRRPTRTESAASPASQMVGAAERAGLTVTPTERSVQSTSCTCSSSRCVGVNVCLYGFFFFFLTLANVDKVANPPTSRGCCNFHYCSIQNKCFHKIILQTINIQIDTDQHILNHKAWLMLAICPPTSLLPLGVQ